MSEKKTLGQVYFEARYGDRCKWKESGENSKRADERFAASIAAVCRAVIAERDKSTEFALRAMQIPRVIAAARQAMEREQAKPEAASEAGDWAMGFLLGGRSLHELSDADQQRYVKKASGLREAAERHYGPIVNELALQRGSTIERLIEERDVAIQERDASRGEWSILMAESGEQLDRHKTAMVEYESAMRDWKEKIDWLEGHCLKHQRDLEKSENEAEQLSFDLSGERAVVAVRNAEIEALKTRFKREVENRDASNREAMKFCKERDEAYRRRDDLATELMNVRESRQKIVDERDRQCNVATAAIRNRDEAQKERDAAHAANKSIQAHNAELVKERDAARADVERLKEALELEQADRRYRNAPPSPAADATGEDELRKAVEAVLHGYSVYGATDFLSLKVIAAVRPLFDAVLAERDEAIKAVECHKSYHDTEQAIKRAEAAESERDKLVAELQELQEAVIASPPMSLRHTTTGTPYWTYTGAELTHPNNLSAILAAFRATKGKEQGDGPK